jgi:uncharacterized protein (TIGR02217 family)
MAFHEVRFPAGISLGATGGPERRTEIVVLGSGAEERNTRWADSKRSYNAGYGIKRVDDLHAAIEFFEERRGRLHGFRWKDWSDYKSCPPNVSATALDQAIGTGNGVNAAFQLAKTYGSAFNPWTREIKKPVCGSVRVAVAGVEIEIFRVNWQDTEQRVLMRTGNLGEVSRGATHFKAEVRGLAHELQQPKGRIVEQAGDEVVFAQAVGGDRALHVERIDIEPHGPGDLCAGEAARRFESGGVEHETAVVIGEAEIHPVVARDAPAPAEHRDARVEMALQASGQRSHSLISTMGMSGCWRSALHGRSRCASLQGERRRDGGRRSADLHGLWPRYVRRGLVLARADDLDERRQCRPQG